MITIKATSPVVIKVSRRGGPGDLVGLGAHFLHELERIGHRSS